MSNQHACILVCIFRGLALAFRSCLHEHSQATVTQCLQMVGTMGCLVACYLSCRASFLVPRRRRPAFVAAACEGCMRSCLFCLGFWRVEWRRLPPKAQHAGHAAPAGAQPGGIVSNHCGWVDILVNSTRYFPSFVARDSTVSLLMIGLIRWELVNELETMAAPAGSSEK